MNTPLIIDNDDPKWVLLDIILKIFGSRRTKQELAKQGIKPTHKAGIMLRIILVAMFFSQDVSYVIRELKKRKELRYFVGIHKIPSDRQIYSFLSRFSEDQFISLVLGILNSICSKRRIKKARIIVDSTDIWLDLNWFRRSFTKKYLEGREFKWGYSPSKNL